jgi:hypothetical protein
MSGEELERGMSAAPTFISRLHQAGKLIADARQQVRGSFSRLLRVHCPSLIFDRLSKPMLAVETLSGRRWTWAENGGAGRTSAEAC